jgi:hypothetical protein
MEQQIVIDSRFCGPPDSGNGGYLGGVIAQHFEGPAEITLNRPIPLGRQLNLEWFEDVVLLCDGDNLVATAEAKPFEMEVPPAPSYQDAVHATRFRLSQDRHPFPSCFVCGPGRGEGDGLRIFPGSVDGTDLVAAPWVPDASLANGDDLVQSPFVHAALDCPGGFAALEGEDPRPMVLGRMVARIEGPVEVGERYVLVGWRVGGSRRKHHVGTALFTADGERRAVAQATWIERS